jgi:hypothetical protein
MLNTVMGLSTTTLPTSDDLPALRLVVRSKTVQSPEQTNRVGQYRLGPSRRVYWSELATDEKALFAFEPMSRRVPTTITRITANITAYSAMS